jgi:hypothetical protein
MISYYSKCAVCISKHKTHTSAKRKKIKEEEEKTHSLPTHTNSYIHIYI